jgi:hypothetical protein
MAAWMASWEVEVLAVNSKGRGLPAGVGCGVGGLDGGRHSLVYFAYTCDNDLLKWGLFTYEKGL